MNSYPPDGIFHANLNALANITRRMTGEFASINSVIYRRSTDVISEVACGFTLLTKLTFGANYCAFDE